MHIFKFMKAYEYLSLLSYERALKNERAKSKIVKKLSLNCTFGQDSSFISDLARPNSNKTVLVHFVFCMMSSFCSMGQVARWTLAREMIKGTNVFYPICLKKHWKKLDRHLWRSLFCERCAITHHSLLKMNQTPC